MTAGTSDGRQRVVIVGGGAAGITVAATLRRRRPGLDVTLIDPAEHHYYQPAFTLVGGGAYSLARTRRAEADCIPSGVTWLQRAAEELLPDENAVVLEDGVRVGYDMLVVCPGLQLDWDRIDGLTETLGRNGVCSNYLPGLADYTRECVEGFSGGTALFTQPDMPVKCPGAPQKIAYLTADAFRRRGLAETEVRFALAGEALFSVPEFVPPLERVAAGHGVAVDYRTRLVSVDGDAREALLERTDAEGGTERVSRRFQMLHVTPPQSAPDFVKRSPLAAESGWVDVDHGSLRHRRYANVFALGDAAATPNSKTAAAIRRQAPVVAANLLAVLDGREPEAVYDGYASCPLVTGYGRVILAEFIYGGTVTPSFPLDPTVERRSMWWLKKYFLPLLYWDLMLKGRHWHIPYRPRGRAARRTADPA